VCPFSSHLYLPNDWKSFIETGYGQLDTDDLDDLEEQVIMVQRSKSFSGDREKSCELGSSSGFQPNLTEIFPLVGPLTD